jgi:putative Mg2+ transporter-C (MgtC) family protein
MPVLLDWQHIALRLSLTVVAGLIIGFNRGEHGRPAGMRTTLLVCLAASVAMLQANLLMASVGKSSDSFVVLDLMRLPLGILSGMGFIGAGAILRKDNLVLGLTTAATLWSATVMGLCFGGGQIGLGIAALALGFGTLWGLKYVEKAMRQDARGTLALTMLKDGPSDDEIRSAIASDGGLIISWGIAYEDQGQRRELRTDVQRRIKPDDTQPPGFVSQLARNPHIQRIMWRPQGISSGFESQPSQPKGTPIPISGPK